MINTVHYQQDAPARLHLPNENPNRVWRAPRNAGLADVRLLHHRAERFADGGVVPSSAVEWGEQLAPSRPASCSAGHSVDGDEHDG
jgi:hypothetical protein